MAVDMAIAIHVCKVFIKMLKWILLIFHQSVWLNVSMVVASMHAKCFD